MISIIWQYVVNERHEVEFLSSYGSDGEWVKLFKKSEEYIKTDLLKKIGTNHTYITIDQWTSSKAYDTFLKKYELQYLTMDKAGDKWTIKETFIGRYDTA